MDSQKNNSIRIWIMQSIDSYLRRFNNRLIMKLMMHKLLINKRIKRIIINGLNKIIKN